MDWGRGEAKTVGDAFLSMTSGVLHAMSHIPGLGFLKGWGDAVDRFKTRFDGDMQTAMDKLDSWKTALANAPKIVTLDAHISDLESKLATAKGKLNDKDLTRTRRAQITANISGLLQQIAAARIALYALQSLSVTIPIGGGAFIHRASGGPGGGLTEVGERGPELMYTPRNSYIFNHADSRQLLNSLSRLGGGGKGRGHHRHHMQPPHQVRTITRHFRDEEMNTHGGVQRFHMDTERTQVPVHVHINFNGIVTNADATAKAVRQMLLNYKRNHGGRDLGLA